ncbi:MAG: hypothetical protein J0H39_19435 [Alphaproteobacteria bacterium]|nr:hypothetical protein [Alphaproteobacteria bacterium]
MNDQMRFLPDWMTVKPGETIRFVVKNVGEHEDEIMLLTKKAMDHAKVTPQHPGMEDDADSAVTVPPSKTGELVWQFIRVGNFMISRLMPGHVEVRMLGSISVRR